MTNQKYEVHCGRCKWWGMEDQLKVRYRPDTIRLGDVIPEPACPTCLSDQYLEYEDDKEKLLACQKYPTTYKARLVLSARYRDKCHTTLLELLRCQTLQSENSDAE